MKDPLQIQAAALLDKLTQERGKDILAIPVKERPTTKALLAAPPELQVAFVRHVVAIFAKIGARTKKKPVAFAWFHGKNVPTAGEEVARLMLRRRLPFTDEIIAEILEQIAGMDFITFAPIMDQLVRELEKRAAEGPLSSRIRKAAGQVADGLLVKDWPAADAENWGLPRAADRKLAARLQSLLAGPLSLG